MEINKIPVGIETIGPSLKVELISKTKADRLKKVIAVFIKKTSGLFLKILQSVKSVFKRIINFVLSLKKEKIGIKEEKDNMAVMNESRLKINKPKKLTKALLLVGILLLLLLAFAALKKRSLNFASKKTNPATTLGDKVEIKEPRKTMEINKEFQFPVNDSKGKELTQFKYFIEKAELRDEIIVKGQKATAVKGRVFLIIYLKITNEYSTKLDIPSKNYIRLSVNGNESEWIAPDIHNDPVEVQAQSTKVTRLGFPIYENDTKLLLRVGEIDGEKEKVELNF